MVISCSGNDKQNENRKKVTHLFMNNKKVKNMNKLKIGKDLKVIYLQNNFIDSITNLPLVNNITHLYLQHNKIQEMANLKYLEKLTKLFLGYNRIKVVEGLENCKHLIELHIEYQQLDPSESLSFDYQTSCNLSKTLEHLNIAGNSISSLRDINGFSRLKVLNAKSNAIKQIEDLADTIKSLPNLIELTLRNNYVTQEHRYREDIIANSFKLRIIDGKPVNEITRVFMKKFKQERQRHLELKRSQTSLSDDITSSLNLPHPFRLSISRAIREPEEPNLSVSFKSTSIELHSPKLQSRKKVADSKTSSKNCRVNKKVDKSLSNNEMEKRGSLEQCAVAIPLLKK